MLSETLPAVAVTVAVPSFRPVISPVSAFTLTISAPSVLHTSSSVVSVGSTAAVSVADLLRTRSIASPWVISTEVAGTISACSNAVIALVT